MPEPTERLLWVTLAVGILGVVSAAIPVLNAAAPVALILLAVLTVADFIASGAPQAVSLQRVLPERTLVGERAQGYYAVQARRAVSLEVVETFRERQAPWSRHALTAPANQAVRVPFAFAPLRRGEHTFGRITLRTRGPLGLLRRRERRAVEGTLRVAFDLVAVQKRVSALLYGHGAGARAPRLRGRGREFDSLREYRRGDDVRQVAWKASARRGTLVVKNTRPEQRQDVWFLLDSGRQMQGETRASTTRYDAAVEATLSGASAALTLGDAVGIVRFSNAVQAALAPAAGLRQLRRLAEPLVDARAGVSASVYSAAVDRMLRTQKRRSLVVLMTDVVDVHQARAVVSAVRRLRGRHVALVCALAEPEVAVLTDSEDVHVARAAKETLVHRSRALAAVAAAGARVVDAAPDGISEAVIAAYMDIKATGQL